MAWQGRHPSIQSRQLAPAVDKPPAHRTSLWTAPAGSVACPPLPGRCLRPDALRLPEQPIEIGTKTLPMATAPHHANGRLKPAQAAPRHRTLAINSDRVRKPIIRPSCLGEFEWPQVGEFEAAIGGRGGRWTVGRVARTSGTGARSGRWTEFGDLIERLDQHGPGHGHLLQHRTAIGDAEDLVDLVFVSDACAHAGHHRARRRLRRQ